MHTFIEQYRAGEATLDEIDDAVASWHASDGPQGLSEFLGLSDGEYAAWVACPDALDAILAARDADTSAGRNVS